MTTGERKEILLFLNNKNYSYNVFLSQRVLQNSDCCKTQLIVHHFRKQLEHKKLEIKNGTVKTKVANRADAKPRVVKTAPKTKLYEMN